MSFITMTNRSGVSITVNTDRVSYVSDVVQEGDGVAIFMSCGSVEIVDHPYLEVVGWLKSEQQGGCCRG